MSCPYDPYYDLMCVCVCAYKSLHVVQSERTGNGQRSFHEIHHVWMVETHVSALFVSCFAYEYDAAPVPSSTLQHVIHLGFVWHDDCSRLICTSYVDGQ